MPVFVEPSSSNDDERPPNFVAYWDEISSQKTEDMAFRHERDQFGVYYSVRMHAPTQDLLRM